MPGEKWSDREEDLLRELIGAGCGIHELHECLPHRGRRSIYQKLYALNLSLAKEPPEPDWEKARQYLAIRKG